MSKLGCCGDDCEFCPRYIATESGATESLKKAAELWHRAGYRDRIVSPEEIACHGCTQENPCVYNVAGCSTAEGVKNCGRCAKYPCEKIARTFAQTDISAKNLKRLLSKDEYELFCKAFFLKKENLDREYRSH